MSVYLRAKQHKTVARTCIQVLRAVSSSGGVRPGWDPIGTSEADVPRRGREIFHQKNTCDHHLQELRLFINI